MQLACNSRSIFRFLPKFANRYLSNHSPSVILGIETSCDDTGCAILDTNGTILGESLHSQHLVHLNNGGIIPTFAQALHRENIERVVNEAVTRANVDFRDISAIATTVKPGLPMSLKIGMMYGKHLCHLHHKPFIPIHHMEAHALTARMHDKSLEFPFLVLLISGGHCLLAIAQSIDQFLLLGSSLDDAPGEAFDKLSRRMKLKNLPEYATLNGGQAIELAASKAGNPLQFKFTIPLVQYRDCNFSVAGLKMQVLGHLLKEEEKYEVPPDGVIPDINNLCAGFQLVLARHLCHRVQRGIEYASRTKLMPKNRQTLVVSGGVACNNFIAKALQIVCDELNYKIVRPPPKLCTDNGVMIAWNGIEKWKANSGILENFDHVEVEKTCPLGEDRIEEVAKESISCKWVKLSQLNEGIQKEESIQTN